MEIFSGTAQIQCSRCRHAFWIDASDLDVHATGSTERQMGAEVYYYGKLIAQCVECDNNIEVEFEGSEYPVGAIDYAEVNTVGGELLRSFMDVGPEKDQEIYTLENASSLLLPKRSLLIANLSDSVAELISAIANSPDLLYRIQPREFEEIIAAVFERNGFRVQLTQQTHDGGRDIIAFRSDLDIESKFIIECKRYAKNRPVSVDLVRSLFGVQQSEGANKAIIATTSHFTPAAKTFAKERSSTRWAMDLKAFDDIVGWIRDTSGRR